MKLIARLGRGESAPAAYRLPLPHFCSLAAVRLAHSYGVTVRQRRPR